jgi:uroporphyrinogen-III synthase
MESLKSNTTERTEPEPTEPLAGFTVGVTAARRSEELITLLERRGAAVVHAPAIRIIPLVDDVELRRVTTLLIEQPPDVVVVTTGIGFRGWVEAAHGWDVADDLISGLGATRIVARGPKARGAIRQAGLCEEWSPQSESSAEVLERLLADGVVNLCIAVQLHGAASEWEPDTDICDALTMAGAQVIKVPVYRWEPPEDPRRMDHLIAMACRAELDAVTFTSAPAVASLLQRAKALGALDELVTAMRNDVAAICVGPVTSAPLGRLGVATSYPERYRLGALARLVGDELPCRERRFTAGGHVVSMRSAGVAVDGQIRTVPPAGMALMRRLLVHPGLVVSREELLAQLPGGGDDTHAVETAIARLRSALGAPHIIQTVVKRGYRLAIDPPEYDES